MKKRNLILLIVGAFLLLGFFLIYHFRNQIGKRVVDGLNLRKGTAKWWSTHSSAESKEKSVFVAYYDALPFEYEDSICHIKLVFDEIYVEWKHWYDYSDTALEHCLYYQNSETVKDQQLIGIYDTMQCVPGIAYILKEKYYKYSDDNQYIPFSDSLKTIADFLPLVESNKGCIPGLFWEIRFPVSCGNWSRLDVDRYNYAWGTTGVNALGGEYGDTIRLPITSTLAYDERCGYNHCMSFPFGELVLIKRKD